LREKKSPNQKLPSYYINSSRAQTKPNVNLIGEIKGLQAREEGSSSSYRCCPASLEVNEQEGHRRSSLPSSSRARQPRLSQAGGCRVCQVIGTYRTSLTFITIDISGYGGFITISLDLHATWMV
jgi:hypothetical protein